MILKKTTIYTTTHAMQPAQDFHGMKKAIYFKTDIEDTLYIIDTLIEKENKK